MNSHEKGVHLLFCLSAEPYDYHIGEKNVCPAVDVVLLTAKLLVFFT